MVGVEALEETCMEKMERSPFEGEGLIFDVEEVKVRGFQTPGQKRVIFHDKALSRRLIAEEAGGVMKGSYNLLTPEGECIATGMPSEPVTRTGNWISTTLVISPEYPVYSAERVERALGSEYSTAA